VSAWQQMVEWAESRIDSKPDLELLRCLQERAAEELSETEFARRLAQQEKEVRRAA